MSCQAYWRNRVKAEITPRYPKVTMIQAIAYGRPKVLDEGTVQGVDPDPGDPIKQVRKYLAVRGSEVRLIILFHPCGGFSCLG